MITEFFGGTTAMPLFDGGDAILASHTTFDKGADLLACARLKPTCVPFSTIRS
jgi:hypothetical protein